REDHDEARPAEGLLDRRRELSDPEQVEEDVQQAAVQIDRGEERPPEARGPGDRAGEAEPDERAVAGREHVERVAGPERGAGIQQDRGDVERDAYDGDRPREVEPAHQPTDPGAEAPEAWAARPAVKAFGGVHPVELAAAVAEARARSLPEHVDGFYREVVTAGARLRIAPSPPRVAGTAPASRAARAGSSPAP